MDIYIYNNHTTLNPRKFLLKGRKGEKGETGVFHFAAF